MLGISWSNCSHLEARESVTANVSNTSKRTEEARHAAQAADTNATRSVQISNIIGLTDQIAFQSNALAYNGGVEATWAGDADKVFGGFAQEFREFAERSPGTAKQTRRSFAAQNHVRAIALAAQSMASRSAPRRAALKYGKAVPNQDEWQKF